MTRRKELSPLIEPTKSELEILQILWKYGPSTVRLVNDKLNEAKREVNYASTLKLMQIMHDKGLLSRDQTQMKHVYAAAQEESTTKDFLLEKFIDNLYEGSASSMMMQLMGNSKTTLKELESIRALIDQFGKIKTKK